MKITSIKATPVNIPLEAPYLWSVGALEGMPKTIVEIGTDEGISGIGETPSDTEASFINNILAPQLIGRDALDIADCELTCVPEWRSAVNIADATASRAFGGIEIALWDIQGKAAEKPCYQLLGGAFRKEIPFTEYFSYRLRNGSAGGERSVAEVVDYCLDKYEKYGSTLFEGKVGFADARTELNLITSVREALGDDAVIRLDANYGWSLPTARRMVRELEPLNIRNIEDPVFGFENMARLRQHSSIPFSTHECDLPHAVSVGGPDAFVANIASLGGIRNTLKFANACDVMGRDFWFYSGDSGVMTTAYLHLSAATASIREPHQSLSRWQTMDVIDQGVLSPRNNIITVPEGPGLGITLNQDKLAMCHAHYLQNGPSREFMNPHGAQYIRLPRF